MSSASNLMLRILISGTAECSWLLLHLAGRLLGAPQGFQWCRQHHLGMSDVTPMVQQVPAACCSAEGLAWVPELLQWCVLMQPALPTWFLPLELT